MKIDNSLFLRLVISFLLFLVLFFMGLPLEIMALMLLFLAAIILFKDHFNERVEAQIGKIFPSFNSLPDWAKNLVLLILLLLAVLLVKAILFEILKCFGFDYYSVYNAWYAKAVNSSTLTA